MRILSTALNGLLFFLLTTATGSLWAQTELEEAVRLTKARNFPAAQLVLEKALKAGPNNAEVFSLMGDLQLATKNPEKAAEYADKAIAIEPGKARYHVLRGNALGMRAQQVSFLRAMTMVGDIRSAYEKAVELEPRNRSARNALFNFFLVAPGVAGGGLDKALVFAEQTGALDNALGHQMKGQILQRQKKPAAALAEYKLALAGDPRLPLINNSMGYLALEMKQVDTALAHFQRQVEIEPENANSFDSLADGWMAKGRTDEAVTAYRKALALNPLFPSSLRGLGKALEQSGRLEEAIAHYRQSALLGAQNALPAIVADSKVRLAALGAKD